MRWLFQKNKSGTNHSENLFKEMVDLEAILVVIIEPNRKTQKVWFEKNLAMHSTIRVQGERSRRRNPCLHSKRAEGRYP